VGRTRKRAERARLKEGGLLRGWAGKEKGERREKGKGFQISKSTQANEFKPRFESKHQKQCTSMNATVNSYISLIN
jgi:hypothetical protein